MPGFSWKDFKKEVVNVKIARAITMAEKKNVNPDFAIAHPDWVKQAQSRDFVDLKRKIKEQVERYQAIALARRKKIG